jgi:predicted MFS family arabinose efflux permease
MYKRTHKFKHVKISLFCLVECLYGFDDTVQGVEVSKASFLLSVIGITNTVGRIACGWVADFPWMDSLLLNNLCLVLATVSTKHLFI